MLFTIPAIKKHISFILIFSLTFSPSLQAVVDDSKPTTPKNEVFYCPADKNYQDFQSGTLKDLNKAKSFSEKGICTSSCFVQNKCQLVPSSDSKELIVDSSSFNLRAINLFLKKNDGRILGFEIMSNYSNYIAKQDKPLNINKLFPKINETLLKKEGIGASLKAGVLSIFSLSDKKEFIHISDNKMFVMGLNKKGELVKTIQANYIIKEEVDPKDKSKTIKVNYTQIAQNDTTEERVGKLNFYSLAGIVQNKNDINFELNKNKINIFLLNGYGEKVFTYSGQTENKVVVGNKTLEFVSQVESSDPKMVEYAIRGSGEAWSENYLLYAILKQKTKYYSCLQNDSLSGDLGLNAFSTKNACETQCKRNLECQAYSPSNNKNDEDKDCQIQEVPINPITDSNGKTIYLSKKTTKVCKKTRQVEAGCEEYKSETTFSDSDDTSYLKNTVNVETNLEKGDFSKATKVFGQIAGAEQTPHIFSGIPSYCDAGLFLPSSSELVAMAVKYALTIGSGALQGAGDASGKAYDAAEATGKNSFTGFFKGAWAGTKEAFKVSMNNFKDIGSKLTQEVFDKVAKNFAISMLTNVHIPLGIKAIKDLSSKEKKHITQAKKNELNFLSGGSNAGANKNADIRNLEDMSGLSEEDSIAADYARCMSVSPFHLDYATIINYQMATDPDALDPEEREKLLSMMFPANKSSTPVIVSPKQIALLNVAMKNGQLNDGVTTDKEADAYFYARYKFENYGDDFQLIPLNAQDMIIAAETICGGPESIDHIRLKFGDRFLNKELIEWTPDQELRDHEAQEPLVATEESGGEEEEDFDFKLGLSKSLDIAIGTLPFYANVVGMVIKDLMEVLSNKANTCKDEKAAQKQNDPVFIRTNKYYTNGLCVQAPYSTKESAREALVNEKRKVQANFGKYIEDKTHWYGNEHSCIGNIDFSDYEDWNDDKKNNIKNQELECLDRKIAEKMAEVASIDNKIAATMTNEKKTRFPGGSWGDGLGMSRYHYCCYDQEMTYIFAEGIMEQLGKKHLHQNDCGNLTAEDVEEVVFTPCEWGTDPNGGGDKNKRCFPRDKFEALSKKMLSGAGIGIKEVEKNVMDNILNVRDKIRDRSD